MISELTALAAGAAAGGAPPPVAELPDYVRFPAFDNGFLLFQGCVVSRARGCYLVVLDDGRFAKFADLPSAYEWYSDAGFCWAERTAPRRALASVRSWFSRLWFDWVTCRGL